MFIIIGTKTGFYKSVLSYEYIENRIKRAFNKFNEKNHANSLTYSSGNSFSKFNIAYLIIAIILLVPISVIKLYQSLSVSFSSSLEQSLIICGSFFFVISDIDLTFVFYFFSANFLMLYFQVDAFYRYIKALVESEIEMNIKIESIRDFYYEIYEHVKITNEWACYFCGLIYFGSISCCCISIYDYFFGPKSINRYYAAIIGYQVLQAVLMTIIAIMLNAKVS